MTDAGFRAMTGVSDLNDERRFCSLPVFLPETAMNIGKTLFAPLMDFLPWKTFPRIVDRCDGDRDVKSMTYADQFRVMAFAPLTYRESLRDSAGCLSAQVATRYHMGLRQEITRSTPADANEAREDRKSVV